MQPVSPQVLLYRSLDIELSSDDGKKKMVKSVAPLVHGTSIPLGLANKDLPDPVHSLASLEVTLHSSPNEWQRIPLEKKYVVQIREDKVVDLIEGGEKEGEEKAFENVEAFRVFLKGDSSSP